MRTLLVKAEAVQDMADAFNWYEDKQLGLGTEFLNEVEEFFGRIAQNPNHYQAHNNQRVAVPTSVPLQNCLRS